MNERKRPNPNPPVIGYTKIYEFLMDNLTFQESWWMLIYFFYASGVLGWLWILVSVTFRVNTIEEINIVLKGGLFLLFAAFTYGIAFGSFVGIVTGLSNKTTKLSEIIAVLLITVPKPYKSKVGLNTEELEQLGDIAKIEQGSADWRGSFLTVAVWGVILGVLAWTERFSLSIPISELVPVSAAPSEMGNVLFWSVFWLILVLLAMRFSWQIAEYIGTFLGRENANRTILLACQEAKFLLKGLNFSAKDHLSIEEKISLESQLFCKIVPKEQRNDLRYKKSFAFTEGDDTVYYLLLNARQKYANPFQTEKKKIKITIPKFICSIKTTIFNKVNQWWRRK